MRRHLCTYRTIIRHVQRPPIEARFEIIRVFYEGIPTGDTVVSYYETNYYYPANHRPAGALRSSYAAASYYELRERATSGDPDRGENREDKSRTREVRTRTRSKSFLAFVLPLSLSPPYYTRAFPRVSRVYNTSQRGVYSGFVFCFVFYAKPIDQIVRGTPSRSREKREL